MNKNLKISVPILIGLFILSIKVQSASKESFITDSIGIDFLGTSYIIPMNKLAVSPTQKHKNYITAFQEWKAAQEKLALDPEHQLLKTKNELGLCDWMFYQMIRRTANMIIPKSQDYFGYTLTKWLLLKESGYDPMLLIQPDRINLYIQSQDSIYNQPIRIFQNRQYVCLNAHDYAGLAAEHMETMLVLQADMKTKPFSFTIDKLPDMPDSVYHEKILRFQIGERTERISLKTNQMIGAYYNNYPVTDYYNQFNVPLSEGAKTSLLQSLKYRIRNMNQKQGVEYLMHFTRSAFNFAPDTEAFGKEKRLSPEETLLSQSSDCEDRAALLYFLVKEIYNIPMAVLIFPEHVTIAVKLDKPIGEKIHIGKDLYTICEATPQKEDLPIGAMIKELKGKEFEVAFTYRPNTSH